MRGAQSVRARATLARALRRGFHEAVIVLIPQSCSQPSSVGEEGERPRREPEVFRLCVRIRPAARE
eukprot:2468859-Alexandrium_andersonii.AAC.1